MRICIWYHGVFQIGSPREFRPGAFDIVREAMAALDQSGLAEAAEEIYTCFNGDDEDADCARLIVPAKAKIITHGLDSFSENLTICAMHEWAMSHPGWAVLYFHSKGASRDPNDEYSQRIVKPWRDTMMQDVIFFWQHCVTFLSAGNDVVCSRFMRGMADGTQNIVPGNFFWARSSFLAMLPSIKNRARIKLSGIGAAESRWESEVWIGNGPRQPQVVQFRPGWDPRWPHGIVTA